jgi:hypothetical protein
VFQKLFGRKKTVVKTKTPAPQPKPAAQLVVASPASLTQEISTAEGKKKLSLMNQLSKMVDQDHSLFESISLQLPPLERAMLQLHVSHSDAQNLTEDMLQKIACEGFNASVRRLAATLITQEQTLLSVAQAAKTKDKSVYRIVKNKLDELHEQQKADDAVVQKQQAIIAAMQQMVKASADPLYDAKYQALLDQWEQVRATSNEQTQAEFDAASRQVSERIEQESKVNEPEPAIAQAEVKPEAPVQTVEATELMARRQTMLDTLLNDLVGSIEAGEFSEEIIQQNQHFLTGIQHQWRESEQVIAASKAETTEFQKASTAYEVGLAKLHSLLTRYGDYDAILTAIVEGANDSLAHELDEWLHDIDIVVGEHSPTPVTKLTEALKAYRATLAEHRQQEVEQVRSIRSQIRRCQSAIDEGSIRRASGLYQGIEDKLVDFNLDQHGGLKKAYDDTTEALEKLRDWQSYAVLPKKEALIKKMGALVHQSVPPDERAQSIRNMQEEWKQLSRGLQNRQQDLWETFHALAQQAYEPCKEFYTEQRHLREVNLAKRKEVVEQLTQYSAMIDWDAPDIKEIDRVLQAARNDWRHYSPVDRAASKNIQKQFDTLHQELFGKLAQEQAVFKEQKVDIIERAKALLTMDDVKKATNEAKALQQEWKAAGIVARKDEQRLWKEFREVCDALFSKRDEQTEAFKADLEENRVKANEVLASLEQLVDSEAPESEMSVFENLKSQYDKLGPLPKEHYNKLAKRYKTVCESFAAAINSAKRAQADAQWQAVITWVKEARFGDLSDEVLAEQWHSIKVPSVAKSLVDVKDQWQMPVDELNQAAMHEKTLDFEILVGAQSPAEDANMRMNLQVQRLSDGIGYQLTDAEVHQSVVEWLSIGAVDKATYEQFESRLLAARNQYLEKNLK